MYFIRFYTHISKFGDCPMMTISRFQKFVIQELSNRYPDHEIIMNDENNLNTCYTDDYANSEEIEIFCSQLWDSWGAS